MRAKQLILMLVLLVVGGLALGACSVNVRGNLDESLTVESQTTEAELQQWIDEAIADPLMRAFTVDMRDGHIYVSAERERYGGGQTDTLAFRLDLGVGDGHLTAAISDAQLNGQPVEEGRVALWNERIANRLERGGRRYPNSTLQSVAVGGDVVTMVWDVVPRR